MLACREAKGWSQERLAQRARCSLSAISRYERGVRVPESRVLKAIAKALGVRLEKLTYERSK
jgi:transcriptional regulator with XRE-family HTH domain